MRREAYNFKYSIQVRPYWEGNSRVKMKGQTALSAQGKGSSHNRIPKERAPVACLQKETHVVGAE